MGAGGRKKERKLTFVCVYMCACMCVSVQALFTLSAAAADACSIQPPPKQQLISIVIMRDGKGCRCQHKFFCSLRTATLGYSEKLCVHLKLVHFRESFTDLCCVPHSAVRTHEVRGRSVAPHQHDVKVC